MPHIRILDTPAALGKVVARDIAARIVAKPGPFLLGCPGGRSPKPVYEALAQLVAAQGIDMSQLIIVMMDDYVLETAQGFDHVQADAHFSCRRFARDDIHAVLNRGLPEPHRIPDTHIWFPDPQAPQTYDARLQVAGGIDYFLLASGASDGHIAFNPRGSARDSISRVVRLADETRADNLRTFPDFAGLDDVPRHGVTVGISTIAAQSRAVGMLVWGRGKGLAFDRLSAATTYDPDWPATIWAECRDATLYADAKAAKGTIA